MIFWRLDPVTATAFSLASKEFQATFKELAPKVFKNPYPFPLDVDAVLRCDDKWGTKVSLKWSLLGWFSVAGLSWDPYRCRFVGVQLLKETCEQIRWNARNAFHMKEVERQAREDEKAERKEERAERKREKAKKREDDRELWLQNELANPPDDASDGWEPDPDDYEPFEEDSSGEDTESGEDESESEVDSEPEDELGLSRPLGPDKGFSTKARPLIRPEDLLWD